ncbi:MAG TPA: ECF-type sigma factor [Chthoniobacterales bacterium]|jgi:RNA polymerase sigma factor (TIGR02999 family)
MNEATQILSECSNGDKNAADRLMPLVYEELKKRAAAYLRRERPDHTLQATALVHEAYIEMIDQKQATWNDRAHFCAVSACIMRRILLEHARGHNAEKRGGRLEKLYLDETRELAADRSLDLVALDDALRHLAENYPRESEVVEMKFFGGLSAAEIATVLDVSEKTVLRDWSFAKLWLRREIAGEAAGG